MDPVRPYKMLVATDGSGAGEHAVQAAESLARKAGAQLEVLGVETTDLPAFITGERVSRNGSTRTMRWARGIPGVEIVRQAEQSRVDLVVLGRRNHSGGFLAPGRTTDAVVRRRAGACLLIPPAVDRLGRMLIALDGTPRGLAILEPAARFAGATGAIGSLVCVIPNDPDFPSDATRAPSCGSDQVASALARCPGLGGPEILRIRSGNPVREIIAELEETGSDLLVIGVRRGGPPGEMGSGHVGQDLLREAPSAILTVPI